MAWRTGRRAKRKLDRAALGARWPYRGAPPGPPGFSPGFHAGASARGQMPQLRIRRIAADIRGATSSSTTAAPSPRPRQRLAAAGAGCPKRAVHQICNPSTTKRLCGSASLPTIASRPRRFCRASEDLADRKSRCFEETKGGAGHPGPFSPLNVIKTGGCRTSSLPGACAGGQGALGRHCSLLRNRARAERSPCRAGDLSRSGRVGRARSIWSANLMADAPRPALTT